MGRLTITGECFLFFASCLQKNEEKTSLGIGDYVSESPKSASSAIGANATGGGFCLDLNMSVDGSLSSTQSGSYFFLCFLFLGSLLSS
jgi:hypothetical protein